MTVAALAFFLILGGGVLWYLRTNNDAFPISPERLRSAQTVRATVGSDQIFQSDIEQNKPLYPDTENTDELILKGLVRQSVILQAASEQGLVELPENVLNTPNRNQHDLIQLTNQVEQAFDQQRSRVEGSLVGIYFLNEEPGIAGVVEGRRIAQEKITAIHQQLRSGQITMEQAGSIIAADTELSRVDPSYKSNAFLKFSAFPGEKITHDPAINTRIMALPDGQVSEILVAKGLDLSGVDFSQPDYDQQIEALVPVDALFLIAQVDRRVDGIDYADFEDWVNAQYQTYAPDYVQ